jgi:hypothetical protein
MNIKIACMNKFGYRISEFSIMLCRLFVVFVLLVAAILPILVIIGIIVLTIIMVYYGR